MWWNRFRGRFRGDSRRPAGQTFKSNCPKKWPKLKIAIVGGRVCIHNSWHAFKITVSKQDHRCMLQEITSFTSPMQAPCHTQLPTWLLRGCHDHACMLPPTWFSNFEHNNEKGIECETWKLVVICIFNAHVFFVVQKCCCYCFCWCLLLLLLPLLLRKQLVSNLKQPPHGSSRSLLSILHI